MVLRALFHAIFLVAATCTLAAPHRITVDTSKLAGVEAILAFDFVDWAAASNEVVITNFDSDAALLRSQSIGDVTGSLSGTLRLSDGRFFNESATLLRLGSFLQWSIDFSDNPPVAYEFPDGFSAFFLDSVTGLPLVITDDPTGSSSFLRLSIFGKEQSSLVSFRARSDIIVTSITGPVPEPSALLLFALGLMVFLAGTRISSCRAGPRPLGFVRIVVLSTLLPLQTYARAPTEVKLSDVILPIPDPIYNRFTGTWDTMLTIKNFSRCPIGEIGRPITIRYSPLPSGVFLQSPLSTNRSFQFSTRLTEIQPLESESMLLKFNKAISKYSFQATAFSPRVPEQYHGIFSPNYVFQPGIPIRIPRTCFPQPKEKGDCRFSLRSSIRRVVVHSTNEPGSVSFENQIGHSHFANVSAHYYIDTNGLTIQVADDSRRLCHVGDTPGVNDDAIAIELKDYPSLRKYPPSQMDALVVLVQNLIDTHQLSVSDVHRHKEFSTDPWHQDPYHLSDRDWEDFLARLCDQPGKVCLSVRKKGQGGVASVPSGILCKPACRAAFDPGTAVSLTAQPAAGWVFLGWSGGTQCNGTAPQISIRLDANQSCTAHFSSPSLISVTSASYGLACGPAAGNVTHIVGPACNGLSSCSILVDNSVFGDPFYGCPKDFEVIWTCSGSGTTKREYHHPVTNEGYTVTAACP